MTTYNRAGVTRRLRELIAVVLADSPVTVTYGWPGDERYVTDDCVWLDYPEGVAETEAHRDQLKLDTFVIPMAIGVTGYLTAEEACEAAEAVLRTIDTMLRRSQRLRHADYPDGDTDAYAGLQSASIRRVVGPAPDKSQADQNGPVGAGLRCDIECKSQLTNPA